MVNIYIVRHGEYKNNVSKKINIKFEVERHLTIKGISQAREVYEILNDVGFNRVIVSDFLRTKETAKEICDLNQEVRDEINEIRIGTEDMDYETHDLRVKKQIEEGFIEEGDESLRDRIEVLKVFIEELKGSDFDNVLVVTHKDVMRLIKIIIEGFDLSKFYEIDFKNCEIYKI